MWGRRKSAGWGSSWDLLQSRYYTAQTSYCLWLSECLKGCDLYKVINSLSGQFILLSETENQTFSCQKYNCNWFAVSSAQDRGRKAHPEEVNEVLQELSTTTLKAGGGDTALVLLWEPWLVPNKWVPGVRLSAPPGEHKRSGWKGPPFSSLKQEATSALARGAGKTSPNSWLPALCSCTSTLKLRVVERIWIYLQGCDSTFGPWPFELPSGTYSALWLPSHCGLKMLSCGKSGNEMLTAFEIPKLQWVIGPFDLYTLVMLCVRGRLTCTLRTRGNLIPVTWFNPAGQLSSRAGPLLKKQMLHLSISALW